MSCRSDCTRVSTVPLGFLLEGGGVTGGGGAVMETLAVAASCFSPGPVAVSDPACVLAVGVILRASGVLCDGPDTVIDRNIGGCSCNRPTQLRRLPELDGGRFGCKLGDHRLRVGP